MTGNIPHITPPGKIDFAACKRWVRDYYRSPPPPLDSETRQRYLAEGGWTSLAAPPGKPPLSVRRQIEAGARGLKRDTYLRETYLRKRFPGVRVAPTLVEEPQPVAAPPRRRRRSSVTALIKHARKAGERGPVRVELPDGTAITSNSEPVADLSDDGTAERLWLERIAKNAAH